MVVGGIGLGAKGEEQRGLAETEEASRMTGRMYAAIRRDNFM
jgi:hypothetical protein